MGGKSQGNTSAPPAAYSEEGLSYLERNPQVAANSLDPWAHYNEYGKGEGRAWGLSNADFDADYLARYTDVTSNPFDHFMNNGQHEGRSYGGRAGGADGGFGGFMEQFQQSQIEQANLASEARAEALRGIDEQREADRANYGMNQRDSFYTDYLSAANSATDYVNSTIDNERANANLLGIEYNVSEDEKAARISDQFSALWSEGDQTRLQGLFDEWGAVDGFEGFNIKRSQTSATASDPGKPDAPKNQRVSSGIKGRKTLATSSPPQLGSLATLGG